MSVTAVLDTVGVLSLPALAGGVGYLAWLGHRLLRGPLEYPAPRVAVAPAPSTGVDPLIAGPPQVRGDSVRDWLAHYTHGRRSWPDAVAEFYRRCAADPQIASYFHDVDLPVLQRHFAAAIGIVTSRGLTARTVVRMAEVHAHVRDEHGRPITGEVYDRTVGVLVGVLQDMGVPPAAVDELGEVVEPLRRAIVAESPRVHERETRHGR